MSSEDGDQDAPGPMVVPWRRLSASALRGVIEEFVTREGTEYGARDVELEAKVKMVQRQLDRGEVSVLFAEGSVNLVTRETLRELGLAEEA